MERVLTAAAAAAGLMLVISLGGCALQRRLIYYPARIDMPAAEAMAAQRGFEPWYARSGDFLGWRAVQDDPHAPRMLVLHGNAGHALHRTFYQGYLGHHWSIHILEYPGFGVQEGRPSEESLIDAASHGFAELQATGSPPVYLLGESLGTGVAAALAARFPDDVAGLLFITPFTSLEDVAVRIFPFLPVRSILQDRFLSSERLQSYHGPLFVLLAGQDEVVPVDLGMQLYEGYTGPKEMVLVEDAQHNTVFSLAGPPVWEQVREFFLQQH